MMRWVLCAAVLLTFNACARGSSAMASADGAVAGIECSKQGALAIVGVPKQFKWHQTVSASLLVCRYSGGNLLKPTWQRANSVDWYIATSADGVPTYVGQGSTYTLTIPSPGYTLTGGYVFVGRNVPYDFTDAADAVSFPFQATQ
ncbi:MAG TPA: hypothetical protein VK760_05925 [Candidatus Acidoferrales bacterium]|jgi:hypothetical protein|nr:hypothetical protein [Candidatus Acidoferrales bacterium]